VVDADEAFVGGQVIDADREVDDVMTVPRSRPG
jgi:hypothetical protein